jgi:starvation-inducible DNA-binding protein
MHKKNLPTKADPTTVDFLHKVLANSYALYLKLQNYHWNVEGANFGPLHDLFASQYNELAEAIDVIAERIRALNVKVPASLSIFANLQTMTEPQENYDWQHMVQDVEDSQLHLCTIIKAALQAANACHDEATADIMIDRIKCHEKAAWMLRAILK